MKKTVYLCMALMIGLSTLLLADINAYSRKAISGPSEIWIAPGAKTQLPPEIQTYLAETFKNRIQLKRFDFNQLPDTLYTKIYKELDTKPYVDETEISNLFEQYAIPEIERILNNPEIQKQRIDAQKEDQRKVTFAETKGKSQNILQEDLDVFFNSSFIYFPYISTVNIISDTSKIQVKVTGGLIWYQVKDDGHGHKSIARIKTIEAEGTSKHRFEAQKTNDPVTGLVLDKLLNSSSSAYNKKDVEKITKRVSETAVNTWCESLTIATKKVPQFLLSAQIIETKGINYTLNMGKREGMDLDDAYQIMDVEEVNGEEKIRAIGFGYLSHVKPEKTSTLRQQFGKKQTIGAYVKEYPRTSTAFSLSLGNRYDMAIKASEFDGLFSKDITDGFGGSLKFTSNLASITGVSQLFAGAQVDLTGFAPKFESGFSGNAHMEAATIFVEKKYWYKSVAAVFNTGLGIQKFKLNGTTDISQKYDMELTSTHLNLSAGVEKLLTPDISFFCILEKRMASGIINSDITVGGIDQSDDFSFSHSKFGGVTVQFGINYIIPAKFKLR